MEFLRCQGLLSPLANQFLKFGLDDVKDLGDCTLGSPRLQLKGFALGDNFFRWQLAISNSGDLLCLLNLMLADILLHDLVIKLVGILLRQIVIDLAFLGLDDVGLLGISHVRQTVFIILDQIFRKELFVLPSCLFLLH